MREDARASPIDYSRWDHVGDDDDDDDDDDSDLASLCGTEEKLKARLR